jgi:hypothetical protein
VPARDRHPPSARLTVATWRTRAGWVVATLVLVTVIIVLALVGHRPLAALLTVMLLVFLAAGPGRLFGDRHRKRL